MVHLLALITLLLGSFLVVDFKQLRESQLLGVGTHVWFVISLAVPIVLHVYIWIVWQSELCSVIRCFGISRAMEIDHFDGSYRHRQFVKEGIFEYTSNSMYSLAFLTLWVIAIASGS